MQSGGKLSGIFPDFERVRRIDLCPERNDFIIAYAAVLYVMLCIILLRIVLY